MFRVPEGSFGYWTHRFVEKGVRHEAPEKRFGETVLPFRDPDGMRLALAAPPDIEGEAGLDNGEIPAETRSGVFTASACCWKTASTRCDPYGRVRVCAA